MPAKVKTYAKFRLYLNRELGKWVVKLVRYQSAKKKPKDNTHDHDDQTVFARVDTARYKEMMSQCGIGEPLDLQTVRQAMVDRRKTIAVEQLVFL